MRVSRNTILIDEAEIERQECAELGNVKLTYLPEEIRCVDTEPNVRGRLKGMFKKYSEQRSDGRFNRSLLRRIKHQLFLYRMISPRFHPTPILCFDDVQQAIGALPKPKGWRSRYSEMPC